jgi:hypothetical protein
MDGVLQEHDRDPDGPVLTTSKLAGHVNRGVEIVMNSAASRIGANQACVRPVAVRSAHSTSLIFRHGGIMDLS